MIIIVDNVAPAVMNFHPVLSVLPILYKVLIARIRLIIIMPHYKNWYPVLIIKPRLW